MHVEASGAPRALDSGFTIKSSTQSTILTAAISRYGAIINATNATLPTKQHLNGKNALLALRMLEIVIDPHPGGEEELLLRVDAHLLLMRASTP